MYHRTLIPLLLCASAVLPAPQQNSNITYVKRKLDLEYAQPDLKPVERESRIEKIPLVIPGNLDKEPPTNKNKETTKTPQTITSQPTTTYNYSDRIYSIKTKNKTSTTTEKNTPTEEVDQTENNNSDDILPETNNSEIVPAESVLNDRVATNYNTGLDSEAEATQSDELVTEKYEEETTLTTVADEETTKAPTLRQLAKLSYFEKSRLGSFSQNLIAHPGKRTFRSRCRCAKIQDCVKLQISVPRCPEEMFMCCL